MDNKGKETIELLTRAEAARYLNIGRRVFIDKGQLNKYIQENMY